MFRIKCLILLALLCIPVLVFNQKKEKFYNYLRKECEEDDAAFRSVMKATDSGFVTTDYYIHLKTPYFIGKYADAEGKIKEGYFKYFYIDEQLQSAGNYFSGRKDGLWQSFYQNGHHSDSTWYNNGMPIKTALRWHGNGLVSDSIVYENDEAHRTSWFDNGKISSQGQFLQREDSLHGTWFFYHKNGSKSAEEIYSYGQLAQRKYYDENGKLLNDTVIKDIESAYREGIFAWKTLLSKHVYFPDKFKGLNLENVVVIVNFLINEDGNIEMPFVSLPSYGLFNKIALDALAHSADWLPKFNHNRKIKSVFKQPIAFSENAE